MGSVLQQPESFSRCFSLVSKDEERKIRLPPLSLENSKRSMSSPQEYEQLHTLGTFSSSSLATAP